MAERTGLMWISLPWATFGAVVTRGVITEIAPIGRWALGKKASQLAAWARRKGAKLHFRSEPLQNEKETKLMLHLGLLLKRARTKYNCRLDELATDALLDPDLLERVEQGAAIPTEEVLDAYASRFRIDQEDIDRLRQEYERRSMLYRYRHHDGIGDTHARRGRAQLMNPKQEETVGHEHNK